MISGEWPDNRCGGGYPFKDCPAGPEQGGPRGRGSQIDGNDGAIVFSWGWHPGSRREKGGYTPDASVSICWEKPATLFSRGGWVGRRTPMHFPARKRGDDEEHVRPLDGLLLLRGNIVHPPADLLEGRDEVLGPPRDEGAPPVCGKLPVPGEGSDEEGGNEPDDDGDDPCDEPGVPVLRPPVMEKRKAFCMMMAATMAMKEAMVRGRTSRFFTWETWCKDRLEFLRGEEPYVESIGATTAWLGLRPVAKASGTRCSDDGDLGFGNVYLRREPVTMAWERDIHAHRRCAPSWSRGQACRRRDGQRPGHLR